MEKGLGLEEDEDDEGMIRLCVGVKVGEEEEEDREKMGMEGEEGEDTASHLRSVCKLIHRISLPLSTNEEDEEEDEDRRGGEMEEGPFPERGVATTREPAEQKTNWA